MVDHRTSRSARRPFVAAVLAVLLAIVALAGCGAESGGGRSESLRAEQSKIAVGTMPVVDAAPLHQAIKKGYFAEEGLEVELKQLQGSAEGVPGLTSGSLQFTFGSWVSFFAAQANGAADLKFVSDGYQARRGTFQILARADSPITGPKDLSGKTIAVNTLSNVDELTTRSVLQTADVDLRRVRFVPMPFPDMLARLEARTVDAVFLVEPYITQAQWAMGAMPIVDTATGPTNEFPIAGYATSAEFAKQNPGTVAAFQRAMAKAQLDCDTTRSEVEELLTQYVRLDKQMASLVNVGSYPNTLESARLQRVVDLMGAHGLLARPIDVRSMILGPVAG